MTSGTAGLITTNYGVTLTHVGTGGGDSYLGSNWAVGTNVVEMYLSGQATYNGQAMVMVCSSSGSSYLWTANEVAYQNGSGLEIENNNGGTPSVLATASPNPTLPAVIGFQSNDLFAGYQQVASISSPICGGTYLAMSTNSGYGATISFNWVRTRAEPPNGVMPIVTFGK